MTRHPLLILAGALALAGLGSPGRAQDKPEAPKTPEPPKANRQPERRAGAMLRVQVVITRFEGDKKLASLPYTFTVTSEGRSARVRMGVETPVPAARPASDEGDKAPTVSYQYKNVGTGLDCLAREQGDGRYQLQLSVDNSSLKSTAGPIGGMPLFRTFNVSLDPVLRDGESLQTVASTDPVTGEVVKIDVTMNVLK
jgi:hypothetical protein